MQRFGVLGCRMLSSMAPTIVTGADGKVILVAGAAGDPASESESGSEPESGSDFRI
jgi:hypothetical protein